MAVFVVMQHVSPDIANWASISLMNDSSQLLLLQFIMRFFTITIAGIAVPMFYAISGYLLFNKSSNTYNKDLYKSQVRKRISSLVIPYFLWNLIVFLLLYCPGPIIKVSLGYDDKSLLVGLLHSFWKIFSISGIPIDGPLYFIRNLFFLVLFSPAIHFLIKRLGILSVVFIATLWLFVDISTDNPLYSYFKALPFFMGGAYVGIKKPRLDWLYKNSKLIIYSFVLCIILDSLFAVGMVDNGFVQKLNNIGYYNEINQFIFRLSNYLGVMAAFCLAGIISFRKRKYESLNSSVFFIYSFHVVVLSFVGRLGGAFYVFPIGNLITYIWVYLIFLAICIIVPIITYYLCKKFVPRISLILSGNRK